MACRIRISASAREIHSWGFGGAAVRVEEKKGLVRKRDGSEIAGLDSDVVGMGARPGASPRSDITNPSSDDSGLA